MSFNIPACNLKAQLEEYIKIAKDLNEGWFNQIIQKFTQQSALNWNEGWQRLCSFPE